MSDLHTERENTIRRYVVIDNTDPDSKRITSAWKTRDLAKKKAAFEKQCTRHRQYSIGRYVIHPNKTILDLGIDRFDSMLKNLGTWGLELVGTSAELVDSGVIGEYVFGLLGKSGTKSSCDEYGNQYELRKASKGRFQLRLHITDEPKKPYGMTKVDPYDTDISDILARVQARGAK